MSDANLPAIAESRDLDLATWSTLRNSVFPGAKDESIVMAVDYCKSRKLDILKKPCHIVPMSVKDPQSNRYEWRDVIMPGIAEYRTTAFRTGEYAGQDEPEFGEYHTFMGVKAPLWCKVTVYRLVKGVRCPYSHTEYFSEAVALKKGKNGEQDQVNAMWTKRPHGQLAKCAEAGALRKAFPEELGGENIADEMIDKEIFMGDAQRINSEAKEPIREPESKSAKKQQTEKANKGKSSKTKPKEQQEAAPEPENTEPPTPANNGNGNGGKYIGPKQVSMIRAMMNKAGIDDGAFCFEFEISDVESLPMSRINDALAFLQNNGPQND